MFEYAETLVPGVKRCLKNMGKTFTAGNASHGSKSLALVKAKLSNRVTPTMTTTLYPGTIPNLPLEEINHIKIIYVIKEMIFNGAAPC